ncbi:hypothetical protein Tco_1426377 [Tanacetum coccineum]
MFLNVDQLEKQLDKEKIQEIESMVAFRVLKIQFQKFINSRFSLDDDDGLMTCKYFLAYTRTEVQQFHDTLIQHMKSVKSIDERALQKREYDNKDTSSTSRNDIDADDADIKHVYYEKPMAEFQQDFSKLEEHCINLELQFQNNVLKSRQKGQFLKAKSNEAKVKKDIDVFETINIELEYSVATLLKETEHLKKTYKDLYDSIKKTRVQTKDHSDSLIAKLNKKSIENADLSSDSRKGFANASLKKKLRKLKGNNVDT